MIERPQRTVEEIARKSSDVTNIRTECDIERSGERASDDLHVGGAIVQEWEWRRRSMDGECDTIAARWRQ